MIVSSLSVSAGQVFVGGWIAAMLLAIYILATRIFRLTSDRYFLFIGACVPGIVVPRILAILVLPDLGLIDSGNGITSLQAETASNFFMGLVVMLAPFAARIRAHRYVWTSLSTSIGAILAAVPLYLGGPLLINLGDSERMIVRAVIEGTVCIFYLIALVRISLYLKGGLVRRKGLPAADAIRFMTVAIALLFASHIAGLISSFTGSWVRMFEFQLEAAGIFLIVDGLIHRGLEIPVRMITRSRAQLEAAINSSGDGVLIVDQKGRLVGMNWRFGVTLGVAADYEHEVDGTLSVDSQLLMKRVLELVPSPAGLLRRIRQFEAYPGAEGFERVELFDGRVFEVYSVPYTFEGRIDGRVWSFRDISLREKTTLELERTRWRLEKILTSAGDGLFEINLETGSLWLHSNWRNVAGWSDGSLPRDWEDLKALIHPEDLPAIMRAMRQPFTRREYRVELRMKDSLGGWRWFLCAGRVDQVDAGNGRVVWVMDGVQRDTTAEKIKEVEIRRQRGLMEALIENMPLGAFVKEMPAGNYVIWNSTLAALTGIPASQVIGRTDVDLIGEEGAKNSARSDEEVVSQGVSVVIENSWLGEEAGRNIRLRKVPVIDSDRTVKLLIGIVEDVTQQQQIERLVHQSRSLEALGRLAGGIAHDFNNILQVIIGAADSLKLADGQSGTHIDEVEQILEAGERARSLIRQLLTFSRQDSSAREQLDMDTVISGLLKMLQRLIGADIAVSIRSSGVKLLVNAEKSRLEQVFMNLTVNAVDAMPYGGSLTIATSSVQLDQSMMAGHPRAQAGRFALISVRDSGIGMPGDVLEHMWEPFFSTKEFGKGTGLGLSTVYGIVESLGGFIQVQSEMGHGTEFKVFLPLAAGSVETSDSVQMLSGVVPATPLSVLVAHRDPAVVARESDALTRAGFNVITATSGPEALERLWQADEQGGVKLMVVDVVMTGMGGRDICDRYRLDHLEVPVVFCAEPASPVLEEEYLRYVNGRLLMSPYSIRKLMLVVRSLIGH